MPSIQLDKITLLSELAMKDPNFKRKLWSTKVSLDARARNEFTPMIGSERSGMPICEKRDLKAGGAAEVTFTTTAIVKGRGRMGEQSLKDNTNTFQFGTYKIQVGLRRFAISYNQLLKYLRLRGDNMDAPELERILSAQWWGDTEMDDIQHVMLRTAYMQSGGRNIIRAGNRASAADLTLADTLHTGVIELAQSKMMSQGAKVIEVATDQQGVEIPKYIFFTPREFSNSLENEQKFRDVLKHADSRGGKNNYFTGGMPDWRGMLIHRHNVIYDSSDGRLGSPLQPIAFLGKAIADENETTITGGGVHNPDGSLTNVALNDFFANFPGYHWATYEGESAPVDNNTYYAIIYNLTDHKYEGISYTASGNDGNKLTVTREVASILPDNHARFSNVHPSESYIIPCTANGVPLGRSLVMGQEALLLAKGALDADRIVHGDDFKSESTGEWHHQAGGVQGIRGWTSPTDTIGRYPNFLVVEHAREVPGVDLVDRS